MHERAPSPSSESDSDIELGLDADADPDRNPNQNSNLAIILGQPQAMQNRGTSTEGASRLSPGSGHGSNGQPHAVAGRPRRPRKHAKPKHKKELISGYSDSA